MEGDLEEALVGHRSESVVANLHGVHGCAPSPDR